MRKPIQPIPEGLNPDEIFAYMHSHGFKNRHPAVGPHVGMAITYYELVEHQREKNNGREQEWRAKASTDEIHQDRSSAEDSQAVEDDRRRDGEQCKPPGVRDSIPVSDDARGTSSAGEDSTASSGAESERSHSNGDASGRSRVGNERPPAPDAPLSAKLDFWGPRLIQREDD